MESIRRSARSTKGQNQRLLREQELEQSIASSSLPIRQKKRNKEETNNNNDDQNGDNRVAEGVVNCKCGVDDENEERVMIECEKCLKWQHLQCVFGSEDESLVPEVYLCDECNTSSNEAKSKAQDDSHSSPVSISPPPPPPPFSSSLSSSFSSAKADSSSSSKVREHSPDKSIVSKKRKTSVSVPTKINDLTDKVRQHVATALNDIFVKIIVPDAIKRNMLEISNEQVGEFSEKLSMDIENALYKHLATRDSSSKSKNKDVGQKYREKFRSLSFNLKDDKNPDLRTRIVSGKLTPDQIVTLSSEEMLNPELQKLAESVRKESIRESVLKVDDAPRLRKTHKGEEFVESDATADYNKLAEVPIVDSSIGGNETKEEKKKERPSAADFWDESAATDNNKNSRLFDHNNATTNSNDMDLVSYSPPRSPTSNLQLEVVDDDDDLDLIVGNDEKQDQKEQVEEEKNANRNDHNIPKAISSSVVFWTGHLTMPGVSEFPASTKHLHSTNREFNPYHSWNDLIDLSRPLTIDGRLDAGIAMKYLRTIGTSKDMITFILQSEEVSGNESGYEKLFDYFHTRKKFGVIQHRQENVKDAYVLTVGQGDEMPDYLRLPDPQMAELNEWLNNPSSNGKVIIGLFVLHSFKGSPPHAATHGSMQPTQTAPIPSNNSTAPSDTVSRNLLQSMGLSDTDLALLQQVILANPQAANDPTMLISLIQQQRNNL